MLTQIKSGLKSLDKLDGELSEVSSNIDGLAARRAVLSTEDPANDAVIDEVLRVDARRSMLINRRAELGSKRASIVGQVRAAVLALATQEYSDLLRERDKIAPAAMVQLRAMFPGPDTEGPIAGFVRDVEPHLPGYGDFSDRMNAFSGLTYKLQQEPDWDTLEAAKQLLRLVKS